MVGETKNRLTCTSLLGTNKHGQRIIQCLCLCGQKMQVAAQDWKSGHTKSCGCLKRELSSERAKRDLRKHGLSQHPLFPTWNNMMRRCYDKNNHAYANYGGRGIRVCKRWHNPAAFIEDVGEKPSKTHSIDRKNNNKGYSPSNWRWATRSQQTQNTRVSRFVTYKGKRLLLREWAELYEINEGTLRTRIDELHWPLEKAFTFPTRPRRG